MPSPLAISLTCGALLGLGLGACDGRPGRAAAEPKVVVFAAASTLGVLDDLAGPFSTADGASVRISGGGSAMLARQIIAGAAPDLFVSAHPQWTERLLEDALLDPDSVFELARNRLVLVCGRRAATPGPLGELDPAAAFPGGLAIADAALAPAGLYAEQVMERLGWAGRADLRVVRTPDVRAALRLAELGEVDAAIVYATDAAASERVRSAGRFDPNLHDPIAYTVGLRPGAPATARRFHAMLRGPAAADVLVAAGFEVASETRP